ncbi:hypothetical protein E4U41_003996 [Claviceps citrina]|nr:hypothetical protein E4U41_003996 [Claviceps citrina]
MSRTTTPILPPRPTRHHLLSPTHLGTLPLDKREVSDCGETHHNCLDIQRPDSCCDNSSYCYVNAQNEARCCPIGSNCIADSPCSSQAYYCTVTLTTALLPSGSAAAAAAAANTTATELGCCGRKCPQTSYFLCPSDLGGKCCPFGSQCQAGGNCLQQRTAAAALPTPARSASACSLSPGAESTSCSGTPAAGDDGSNDEDGEDSSSSSSSGIPDQLSVGIKAAIGLCVTVMLLVVLGAAWFYLRRRWRKRMRKGDDISNRAELTGSVVPKGTREMQGSPQQQHHPGAASDAARGLVASEADDGIPQSPRNHTIPVEIASVEAVSPVSQQERTYTKWPSIQPEYPGGAFELEGSQAHAAEQPYYSPLLPPPSPPTPPRPSAFAYSDYPPDKKEAFQHQAWK